MKIGVVDADWRGHHPSWIPPVADALSTVGDLTLFISEALAERVPEVAGIVKPLPANALSPKVQLDFMTRVAESGEVDHLVHLDGIKAVLREWQRRPALPVPCSVVLTHPSMLHYPSLYRRRLTLLERANASYKEHLVRRWRRRPDAHSVLAMEEAAVERWSRQRGAPAYFWPEPHVGVAPAAKPAERHGAVVCGAIGPGKNIDGIAQALGLGPTDTRVVIAGEVDDRYRQELSATVERLSRAGVEVDLRARWHTPVELTDTLAQARCLLAPYLRQPGTSRTLIHAAFAGTPVVAHNSGLLGHTVERYGIGIATDCTDPRALRDAILALTQDDTAVSRYAPALAEFAELHSVDNFRAAVTAPFART